MNARIGPSLGRRVLVIGEYYHGNASGGMAAVLQYLEPYYDALNFIPSYRSPGRPSKMWYGITAYLRMCVKLLFHPEIRIVHIHTASGGSFFKHAHFVGAAGFLGRKVILHSHSGNFRDFYEESTRKEKILSVFDKADVLVVLSDYWAGYYASIGVAASKIRVLNNIVGYPALSEPAADDGLLHLLFMGVIKDNKGIFELVDTVAAHADGLRGRVRLKICGRGEDEKLAGLLRDSGVADFVTFDGFVAGEGKADVLNWADAIVLPSWWEGLPISLLEAMSYGCAVIATPVGAVPEIVVPEENGLLVPPHDSEALYNAIMTLTDRDLCRKMGQRGAEMVRPFYPDAVVAKLAAIYSELPD